MTEADDTVFVHPSGAPVSTLPQAFQQTSALLPNTLAIRTPLWKYSAIHNCLAGPSQCRDYSHLYRVRN